MSDKAQVISGIFFTIIFTLTLTLLVHCAASATCCEKGNPAKCYDCGRSH